VYEASNYCDERTNPSAATNHGRLKRSVR
jgi:hypothetical protein